MNINLDDFRSVEENPEAWKEFTFLFENRDRHHPFLVISDNTLYVCDSVAKVSRFDKKDLVLKQWPGQYRSDWFWTTVGEFIEKIKSEED